MATADDEGALRVFEAVEPWPGFLGQQIEVIQVYGSSDPMTQRALGGMRDSLLRKLRDERPEFLEEVSLHFASVASATPKKKPTQA